MDERRADVARARREVPLQHLREAAASRVHHSLHESLLRPGGTRVIAELKQASPSAGVIRAQYDPAATAGAYERAGAAGISVLTEPRHFQGDSEHLRKVRASVSLPVLRKDFLCDPYQVWEAAAWGADVVLLIAAALDDAEMRALHAAARECGLDVLAEAHTAGEVERILPLERVIVGVNSRNLKTLKTDLSVAEELASVIPADRLAIAESGIRQREDILRLEACGYRGFLVGESLMADPDPGAKLRELLGTST